MIAELERAQLTAKQSKTQHQIPTNNGATTNNDLTAKWLYCSSTIFAKKT